MILNFNECIINPCVIVLDIQLIHYDFVTADLKPNT